MSFARALRDFKSGSITREDLFAEVDRMLHDEGANPQALLSELDRHSTDNDLPGYVTAQVRSRIEWAISSRQSDVFDRGSIVSGGSNAPPDTSASTRMLYRPPKVGDRLGKYRLEEQIGGGGMSLVFRATDEKGYNNPTVALKVLNEQFGVHEFAADTLKREALKTRELNGCPNIVSVWDCDEDGPHVYMCMEFLPGDSLDRYLRRFSPAGLPKEEALIVVRAIAKALDYAHERDMVHSDLKPSNVMIDPQGIHSSTDVKVIDFGIIRPATADQTNIANLTDLPGNKLGAVTIAYAAPEMLRREPADPRDDVYALAIITYECYTGRHPFSGRSQEPHEILAPDPSLSAEQVRAIEHALAYDRQSRTPSAAAFIEEFAPEEAIGTYPTRPIRPTQQTKDRTKVLLRLVPYVAAVFVAVGIALLFSELYQWWQTRPGTTFRDCAVCPELVIIPAGSFIQGSNSSLANESPPRTVNIALPFALGITEVTVSQFSAYADEQETSELGCMTYQNGDWSLMPTISWSDPGLSQSPTHPAVCVSHDDARGYADWLSQRTGERYRLPSAAEWEYATRAGGAETPWSAGDSTACQHANMADQSAAEVFPGWDVAPCDDGYVHTAPTAQHLANAWGVHDALGNAFEWVADCWQDNYSSAPLDGSALKHENCSRRELRGGSWYTPPKAVRAGLRSRYTGSIGSTTTGFRVLREFSQPEE